MFQDVCGLDLADLLLSSANESTYCNRNQLWTTSHDVSVRERGVLASRSLDLPMFRFHLSVFVPDRNNPERNYTVVSCFHEL